MPLSSEIIQRLSADNSNYRSVMNQSERIADQTGKSIFKKLDLRAGSVAIAAAIGLNINAIAESVARFVSGVTKKEEEALKSLAEVSSRVAEAQIAQMRSKASLETQYQLLLQDQERLQRSIADTVGSSAEKVLAREQAKEDLIKAQIAAAAVLAKIEDENGKLAEDRLKNEMSLREQLEGSKKRAAEDEKRFRQEAYDLQQKADEDNLESTKENLELLTLQAKKIQGLTADEAERLKVLQLISRQKVIEDQMTTLLSLKSRTPQEEATLQSLIRQNVVIKDQIKLVGNVQEAVGKIAPVIESNIAKWREFSGVINSTGRGDKELSDRELERKIQNISADIFQRQLDNQPNDFLLEAQKGNLQQSRAELNFRKTVRQRASAFGEEAAFQQFGGLTEQRFQQILQGIDTSAQGRIANSLERLTKQADQGFKTVLFGAEE